VGPATYYPKPDKLSEGYTMLGKPNKVSSVTIVPGPDKYNLVAAMNYMYPSVKKRISAPHEKENKVDQTIPPGPGSYNLDIPIQMHGPEYHKPSGVKREARSANREVKIKYKPERIERVNRAT
jgi:hypothetical protein